MAITYSLKLDGIMPTDILLDYLNNLDIEYLTEVTKENATIYDFMTP